MKKMKIFYDFEFLAKKNFVDVISGGFVREDGAELYFVLDSFDTSAVLGDWWMMKNVMCSIDHRVDTTHTSHNGDPVREMYITDPNLLTPLEARLRLLEFTKDIEPEWWAWYGAYDHFSLCSIMGRMIDLPANWPMYTCDLKQLHRQKGYCEIPIKQAEGKHNALDDARFNVERYNYLLDQPDTENPKYKDKKIVIPEKLKFS